MTKLERLKEIRNLFLNPHYNNCFYRMWKYKNNYYYMDNHYYTSNLHKKHIIKDAKGFERKEFREENQTEIEIVTKDNINILLNKELKKN